MGNSNPDIVITSSKGLFKDNSAITVDFGTTGLTLASIDVVADSETATIKTTGTVQAGAVTVEVGPDSMQNGETLGVARVEALYNMPKEAEALAWAMKQMAATRMPATPTNLAAKVDGRRVDFTWECAEPNNGYKYFVIVEGTLVETETITTDDDEEEVVPIKKSYKLESTKFTGYLDHLGDGTYTAYIYSRNKDLYESDPSATITFIVDNVANATFTATTTLVEGSTAGDVVITIKDSEWIENTSLNTENDKQDCEVKAFKRMAPRIKRNYPKLKFIVTGDALYATTPMINICKEFNWLYIFNLKKERLKNVYEEFEDNISFENEVSIENYHLSSNIIFNNNKLNAIRYVENLDNNKTVLCNCIKQKIFDIDFNKSNIGNLDKENFKKFNLNLYSDEVNESKYNADISPRENIKIVAKAAKGFIKNFNNPNEKNLLFSGGTGLGKTFLSNCIVAELLSQGKTVLYQTAPVMLDTLINELFDKDSNNTFSQNLLSVELLVIDDLGTETMNSMKFTELYKIINTRLLNQNGKITKTIISTNLDLQGLFNTYDERIVSRFIGNYNIFRFFGDDIRFKKGIQ